MRYAHVEPIISEDVNVPFQRDGMRACGQFNVNRAICGRLSTFA
jgi:hypothetical protein